MPVNVSAEEEQELVPKLKQMIEDAERVYDVRFKVAKEHFKNYNSIRSKRFYKGRSDIFVPFSFMLIETIVARVMRAIYSDPVPVQLQGVGPTDKDREERIRALIHMQQKKIVKLKPKLTDYWRGKAIYGRGYARVDWRTEYRTVKKTVAVDSKGVEIDNLTEFRQPVPAPAPETLPEPGALPGLEQEPLLGTEEEAFGLDESIFPVTEGGIKDDKRVKVKEKEVRVADYDCWDLKPLDFFDVLVDPMATNGDIKQAKWVSIRTLLDDDELAMWGNTLNADDRPIFEQWENMVGAGEGDPSEYTIDRKELLGLNVSFLNSLRTTEQEEQKHEVHEIYMDYKFKGDDYVSKNALFFLINRQKLIRAEKNPWWHGRKPIISGPYTRRPNEFLGQGVLDPIRKIQYEINDKRNQELDYATLSLSPVWLVGDEAELEDSNIQISQQTAIRVADINAIKPLTFPDMTPVGQRAEAIMEQNLRDTTGVTRASQGISEPGRQTAFEVSQLSSQADERINMTVEEFSQSEWVDLFEMVHSLNQQFLKKDTFVRLTEREGKELKLFGTENEVSQAEIAMDVDFVIPSFTDIQIENARNRNLIPFMQIMAQSPPSPDNQTFFNMMTEKLWVDVFKFPREDLYDDNGERILLSPPGFASIFDTDIKREDELTRPPEQTAVEEGGAVPENADLAQPQGELDLASLGLTGGIVG